MRRFWRRNHKVVLGIAMMVMGLILLGLVGADEFKYGM